MQDISTNSLSNTDYQFENLPLEIIVNVCFYLPLQTIFIILPSLNKRFKTRMIPTSEEKNEHPGMRSIIENGDDLWSYKSRKYFNLPNKKNQYAAFREQYENHYKHIHSALRPALYYLFENDVSSLKKIINKYYKLLNEYDLVCMSHSMFAKLKDKKYNLLQPILVKNKNGNYSIFGYKEDKWKLSLLDINLEIPSVENIKKWDGSEMVRIAASMNNFEQLKKCHNFENALITFFTELAKLAKKLNNQEILNHIYDIIQKNNMTKTSLEMWAVTCGKSLDEIKNICKREHYHIHNPDLIIFGRQNVMNIKFQIKPYTLLHAGAQFGDLNLVKHILKDKKTKVNLPYMIEPEKEYTSIHLAVKEGHLNVTQYLVKKFKKCNIEIVLFIDVLLECVSQNNVPMISYLFNQNKDVFIPDNSEKYSSGKHINDNNLRQLFGMALYRENNEMVQCIYESHVFVKYQQQFSEEGKNLSAFIFNNAIKRKNEKIINYLINDKYIDIKRTDNITGENAFSSAICSGDLKTVEGLLQFFNINEEFEFKTPLLASRSLKTTTLSPLHVAVEQNNPSIVENFIDLQKADVFKKDSRGFTPFQLAIKYINFNIVKVFSTKAKSTEMGVSFDFVIEQLIKINSKLQKIIKEEKEEIDKLDKIKKSKSKSNEKFQMECEIVLEKIQKQKKILKSNITQLNSIINYLIEIDFFKTNSTGETPLHIAAKYGKKEIIKNFIKNGAIAEVDAQIINQEKKGTLYTPLHIAVLNGHKNVVSYLIKIGANIKQVDANGNNIIHLAVMNQSLNILKYLISLKKKKKEIKKLIRKKNNEGKTSFQLAILYENLDVIKYFINFYKNESLQDIKDILFYAIKNKAAFTVIQAIIETESIAINNLKDSQGNTLLHALYFPTQHPDKNEIITYLVSKGVNVNISDNKGLTPLFYEMGLISPNQKIIECLVENGNAQINYSNSDGMTCLHMGALAGKFSLTQYFIEKGANVNALNKENYTPLHFAVLNRHIDIIDLLIHKNANPTLRNKYNRTPLDLVLIKNFSDHNKIIVELLGEIVVDNCTPLGKAIAEKDIEKIKALLCYNINPNQTYLINEKQTIPWLEAINSNDVNLATLIWRKVAPSIEANIANYSMYLSQINEPEIIIFLLKHITPVTFVLYDFFFLKALQQKNEVLLKQILQLKFFSKQNINMTENFYFLEVMKDNNPQMIAVYLSTLNNTESLRQCFLSAAKNNCLNAIKYLETRVNVNQQNTNDRKNALILAAEKGCDDIISYLSTLDKIEPNVYIPGLYQTPLAILLKNDNIPSAKVLLEHPKTDPGKFFYGGIPPICLAVQSGDLALVRMMLNKNISTNVTQNITPENQYETPLAIAVSQMRHDMILLLLEHGADPNFHFIGLPSLYIAIQNKDITTINLLLDGGAFLDHVNYEGNTPLIWAIKLGHVPTVKLLLSERHAQLHLEDKQLHLEDKLQKAFEDISDNQEMWDLLDNSSPPNDLYINGDKLTYKVLFNAAVNKDSSIILGFLYKKGFSIEKHISLTKDYQKSTLFFLIENNKFCIVNYLLMNQNVNVNVENVDGSTPLFAAISTGNAAITKLLLEKGADRNKTNKNGISLQTLAKASSNPDIRKCFDLPEPQTKSGANIQSYLSSQSFTHNPSGFFYSSPSASDAANGGRKHPREQMQTSAVPPILSQIVPAHLSFHQPPSQPDAQASAENITLRENEEPGEPHQKKQRTLTQNFNH